MLTNGPDLERQLKCELWFGFDQNDAARRRLSHDSLFAAGHPPLCPHVYVEKFWLLLFSTGVQPPSA